jgi:TolB protein
MGTQLIIRTEAETGKRLAGYIYRVNADGSDLVNLSKQSDSRYAAMPAWSADGTEIVYTATKPGDAVPSLYVMGRDGSNPRQVADLNFEAQYPSWSVDGRIAFAGGVSGGSNLLDAPDGTELARLTEDPGDDSWPTYSPDGTKIAFFSNRDETDGIWVMNADGTDPRRIAEGGEPNWSPRETGSPSTVEPQNRPWSARPRPDGSEVHELFDRASFPAIRP